MSITPEALLAQRVVTTSTRPLGQASDSPYRIGQITSVAGLGRFPMTVTLGEGVSAVEAVLGLNPWDVQVYDTVAWLVTDANPVVIAKLPARGSPTLLAADFDDDPDPWHVVGGAGEPAFGTNWINFGGVHAVAAFRKQTDGWVSLKGLVKRTSGSVLDIFQLPEGYRPEIRYYFNCKSHNDIAQVWVEPDGMVHYFTSGDVTQWLSLIDIYFPTKVNQAALIAPVIEGYDSTISSNVGEAVRTFLRGDGWCWWTGVLRDSAPPASATVIMRIDSQLAGSPFGKILHMLATGGALARLDFGGTSEAGFRSPCRVVYQNTSPATAVVLGGTNYWPVAGANAPWVDASYQNFWATYVGADLDLSVPAQYLIDQHGMVHLRGLPTGAARTADTIFTLPVGFRPLETHVFKSNSGSSHGRLDVTAAGAVQAFDAGASFRALDGIHFYAEQ